MVTPWHQPGMLLSTLLAISVWADTPVAPSPRARELADHFVALVLTGPNEPADDWLLRTSGDDLARANPGREAEARRIARAGTECISTGMARVMPQAAREAALAFDERELEQLIVFVESNATTPSGPLPAGREAARQLYGRWMYSVPAQPAAVSMMRQCVNQTTADLARAGLRSD